MDSFTIKLVPAAMPSARVELADTPSTHNTVASPGAEPSMPQSAVGTPSPASPTYATPISIPTGVEHASPPTGASETSTDSEAPHRYRTL